MDMFATALSSILVSTGSPNGTAALPAELPAPPAEERLAKKLDRLFQIRIPGDTSPDVVQRLITSLQSLEAGWAGAGSTAPSARVIKDIQAALSDAHFREPEVEVDTDGSVALLWANGESTFALTFMGNGQVVGTTSPQSTSQLPWALPSEESEEIASRLAEREAVAKPS